MNILAIQHISVLNTSNSKTTVLRNWPPNLVTQLGKPLKSIKGLQNNIGLYFKSLCGLLRLKSIILEIPCIFSVNGLGLHRDLKSAIQRIVTKVNIDGFTPFKLILFLILNIFMVFFLLNFVTKKEK